MSVLTTQMGAFHTLALAGKAVLSILPALILEGGTQFPPIPEVLPV